MSAVASAAVNPVVLTVGVADPVQRMLQAMLSTSVDSVFLPAIANPIQAVDAVLRHCPKLVVLDLRHRSSMPSVSPACFAARESATASHCC